jgi:FSR family fosmidomycin resistance protein-like MFS transporter
MKASMTYYLPTFLTSQGHTLQYADLALTVLQLAGAAGALFAGTLSDKLGRTRTLFIVAVAAPLLTLLFLNLEGYWIFPVLLPLGFFLFAPTSVMLATVQELDTDKKAFVNSIYMTLNFFVGVMVYPIVGTMIDHFGFIPTFRVIAFLAFGAVLVVLFTRKKLTTISVGQR